MPDDDFIDLTADTLKGFMADHHEKEYLLVDVRQPFEYEQGHIPGALFLPLMELEANLYGLPDDRHLVFYCRSGGRSAAAAGLVVDGEVTNRSVYNLRGGMLAWDGYELTAYPRLETFGDEADFETLLVTAMNLEKGALNFYRLLLAHPLLAQADLQNILEELARAEEGHARLVFNQWRRMSSLNQDGPDRSFEEMFASLAGDIVEGGLSLADWSHDLAQQTDEQGALGLIEMAMQIEYSAYDLYRNMAQRSDSKSVAEVLQSVAQSEKAHLQRLVKALKACQHIGRI